MTDRYFQGSSYRGIVMRLDDMTQFYYACKNNHSAVVETHTFSSTSKDKRVAYPFSGHGAPLTDGYSVMIEFVFPVKCETAIDLSAPSNDGLSWTQFPEEEEVLVLPFTLFKVIHMAESTETEPFTIKLEHVAACTQSLKSFLKHLPTMNVINEI